MVSENATPASCQDAEFKRVHFIGIGGAGMSGIALVLHQRGYVVTGSDLKSSRYTRPLVRDGLDITIGHEAATIDRVEPDVVVISSAIPQDNPELVRARELGIDVWPRARMLSYLSRGAVTIAVAGTHGKTTTSSLAATMLDKLDASPTFLIGGIIDGYEVNGNNGTGPYFVAEADESDGSFLLLKPDLRDRYQHRGRPSRPLRLTRGDRGGVLQAHGLGAPRGRGHRLWRGPPSARACARLRPQGRDVWLL